MSCAVAAAADAVDVYAAGLMYVAAVATLTTVVADTGNSVVSCAAVAAANAVETYGVIRIDCAAVVAAICC